MSVKAQPASLPLHMDIVQNLVGCTPQGYMMHQPFQCSTVGCRVPQPFHPLPPFG